MELSRKQRPLVPVSAAEHYQPLVCGYLQWGASSGPKSGHVCSKTRSCIPFPCLAILVLAAGTPPPTGDPNCQQSTPSLALPVDRSLLSSCAAWRRAARGMLCAPLPPPSVHVARRRPRTFGPSRAGHVRFFSRDLTLPAAAARRLHDARLGACFAVRALARGLLALTGPSEARGLGVSSGPACSCVCG